MDQDYVPILFNASGLTSGLSKVAPPLTQSDANLFIQCNVLGTEFSKSSISGKRDIQEMCRQIGNIPANVISMRSFNRSGDILTVDTYPYSLAASDFLPVFRIHNPVATSTDPNTTSKTYYAYIKFSHHGNDWFAQITKSTVATIPDTIVFVNDISQATQVYIRADLGGFIALAPVPTTPQNSGVPFQFDNIGTIMVLLPKKSDEKTTLFSEPTDVGRNFVYVSDIWESTYIKRGELRQQEKGYKWYILLLSLAMIVLVVFFAYNAVSADTQGSRLSTVMLIFILTIPVLPTYCYTQRQ